MHYESVEQAVSQLKKLENEAKKRAQQPKVEEVKSTAVDQ